MNNSIIPNLYFGSTHASLPPPGELLLITDHLDSSAEFILHRILASHLKEVKDSRAVILSLSREAAHWRAIAAKSNVNLASYQSSGAVTLIEGLTASAYGTRPPDGNSSEAFKLCPPLLTQEKDGGLRSLYFMIDNALQGHSHDTQQVVAQQTVIIDDISMLELIGVPIVDLTRFFRALRALCRFYSASLVVRAHALSSYESSLPFESELLRFLLDSCNVHVEVWPLASGRSGAVSGEVAVHRGGLCCDDTYVSMGRRTAMQYRLSDGGVIFFQRGMGAGVL